MRLFGRRRGRRLIVGVREPTGPNVIRSISGQAVHVAQPRGEAYLSQVGSGGALGRAAEARRRTLGT